MPKAAKAAISRSGKRYSEANAEEVAGELPETHKRKSMPKDFAKYKYARVICILRKERPEQAEVLFLFSYPLPMNILRRCLSSLKHFFFRNLINILSLDLENKNGFHLTL